MRRGQRAQQRMQPRRVNLFVALDRLDGAVERNVGADLGADLQRLVERRLGQRKLVDQPVAEMLDIGAAAAIHHRVVGIGRVPGVEPVDDAVERRARDQFAVGGAENADRRFRARQDVEHAVTDQRLKHAVADAENDEVVIVARLRQRVEGQMMHIGLPRQQRVDHVQAKPVAEIAGVAFRNHRHAARRHRRETVGRRQPHQHLPPVDRRRALNAKAKAVEQLRQIEVAQVVGKAERRAVRPAQQIGRAVTEDHVLLAEAQMGEQVFQIGDIFKNTEHDDDVGLRRRVCREVAADKIADQRSLAVREAVRGLIGAAER